MNARIVSACLLSVALALVVSGCLSGTTQGPGGSQGTQVEEGQSAGQQEAGVLGELGGELISEGDTVEIGEMV